MTHHPDRINDYQRLNLPAPSTTSEPQSSRSASIDAKPPPGMEHGGHPGPWSANSEQHANGSYTNGSNYPTVVNPPHPHEQQQFQAPNQPPAQPFAPPAPHYAPGSYVAAAPGMQYPQRRKQVRAAQACNHCRARKQKCDEARPCQFCRDNNLAHDCQYKDIPPPKQDRSMMQLQETVNSLQDTVNNVLDILKQNLADNNVWRSSVESRLPDVKGSEHMSMAEYRLSPEKKWAVRNSLGEQSGTRIPTPVHARAALQRTGSVKTESPVAQHSTISPLPVTASTLMARDSLMAASQPPASPAESVESDQTNLQPEHKSKAGLQGDHTTPAHKVLQDWPSMASFCDGIDTFIKLKRSEERRVGKECPV